MTVYNNNKIIAIGDIHADYYIFIEILIKSNLIQIKNLKKDCNYQEKYNIYSDFKNIIWSGRDTYVVQMGDILDGKRPNIIISKIFYDEANEIKINNFLFYLDHLARQCGGRVISLLGNHELYPYYKYQDLHFEKQYVKKTDIREYLKIFKKNRFKYYYPGNEGAKMLGKTRPLLLQLGEYLFCHGSITKQFLELYANKDKKINVNKINDEVSEWLQTGNKKPKFIDMPKEYNPLFSKLITDPLEFNNKNCDTYVNEILKYFNGVKYLVVGHSAHNKINCLCNKVYQIDLGLSRAFGYSLEENLNRIDYLII